MAGGRRVAQEAIGGWRLDRPSNGAAPTYSVDEAAKRLGVGRSALYAAVKRGEVSTLELGTRPHPRWFVDNRLSPNRVVFDRRWFSVLKRRFSAEIAPCGSWA